MKFDIIGIGEALIEFAEYEPKHFVQSFAGDVLNSLYYASRLGLKTSFVSAIGADEFGNDLLAFLQSTNIDTSNTLQSSKTNGLYIIRSCADGEPTFLFHRSDSAARTMLDMVSVSELARMLRAKVIVTSAIALAVFKQPKKLIQAIRNCEESLFFFDLNVRRSLWPMLDDLREHIRDIATAVTILSVSMNDDAAIYGVRSIESVLEYYSALGYRNIILRNGAYPVHLRFSGIDTVVATNKVVGVIDTTGAGDAFNAAFIFGFLKGCRPEESAILGNQAAAQVIRFRGGIVSQFEPSLVTL